MRSFTRRVAAQWFARKAGSMGRPYFEANSDGVGYVTFGGKPGGVPRGALYHGGVGFKAHTGLCLTDDRDSARAYAMQGGDKAIVFLVSVPLRSLDVRKVKGYNYDRNYAPGDSSKDLSTADVIEYKDADPSGGSHWTWRLMSPKAVRSAKLVRAEPADLEEIPGWAYDYPGLDDALDIEIWLDDAPYLAAVSGWYQADKGLWVGPGGHKASNAELSEVLTE